MQFAYFFLIMGCSVALIRSLQYLNFIETGEAYAISVFGLKLFYIRLHRDIAEAWIRSVDELGIVSSVMIMAVSGFFFWWMYVAADIFRDVIAKRN